MQNIKNSDALIFFSIQTINVLNTSINVCKSKQIEIIISM